MALAFESPSHGIFRVKTDNAVLSPIQTKAFMKALEDPEVSSAIEEAYEDELQTLVEENPDAI